MLARCQPPTNTQTPAESLLNISVCTTPYDSTFQDGFKSFPSGHSSCMYETIVFEKMVLKDTRRLVLAEFCTTPADAQRLTHLEIF
jgi:hypothetical protein